MAKDYSYRNLILWQRAQDLAIQVIQIVRSFPNEWGNVVIARQIIASATSIGANIAEGHARFTPNAYRNHLSIARGSTAETDSWIDLLKRMQYITEEREQLLHEECVWLMKSLAAKIKELEQLNKDNDSRVREGLDSYDLYSIPLWPFTEDDYQ